MQHLAVSSFDLVLGDRTEKTIPCRNAAPSTAGCGVSKTVEIPRARSLDWDSPRGLYVIYHGLILDVLGHIVPYES